MEEHKSKWKPQKMVLCGYPQGHSTILTPLPLQKKAKLQNTVGNNWQEFTLAEGHGHTFNIESLNHALQLKAIFLFGKVSSQMSSTRELETNSTTCAEHLRHGSSTCTLKIDRLVSEGKDIAPSLTPKRENTTVKNILQVKILFVQVCCFSSVWARGCELEAPQPHLVANYVHSRWSLWCNLLTILWPKCSFCSNFVSHLNLDQDPGLYGGANVELRSFKISGAFCKVNSDPKGLTHELWSFLMKTPWHLNS